MKIYYKEEYKKRNIENKKNKNRNIKWQILDVIYQIIYSMKMK